MHPIPAIFLPVALLLASACTPLPTVQPLNAGPLSPMVHQLTTRAEADLDTLMTSKGDRPAIIRAADTALGSLRAATLATLASATRTIDATTLTLGVTLRMCANGTERFRQGFASPDDRQAYAGGKFRMTCLLPLAVLNEMG